jgi:hypothetical protein
MRIWADPDKKIPLQLIHFGKVAVGHEKTVTVYLENDSKAVLSNLIYDFPRLPVLGTLSSAFEKRLSCEGKKDFRKVLWEILEDDNNEE